MTRFPSIATLDSLGAGDVRRYGGKAAILGELRHIGVPVFPAVAVAAGTCESLFDKQARTALDMYWKLSWQKRTATPEKLGSLRRRLEREIFSLSIAQLVQEITLTMQAEAIVGPVLVRSSATVEDSAASSFAGQFDSVEADQDPLALADAIKRVWASALSSHLKAYFESIDSEHSQTAPSMGLVIQPYVTFETSGVVFTRHPTVPVDGWLLLEFLEGQPSALVGGEATPWRVRVNAETHRVAWERRPNSATLSPNRLRELVGYSSAIKGMLKADADIEWGIAIGDRTLYILQARPMTT